MKTQLLSQHGLYLSVDTSNGNVQGQKDPDASTFFYLIPVGLRVVSIQQCETLLYLGMNSEGRLFTTVSVKHKRSRVEPHWSMWRTCTKAGMGVGRIFSRGATRRFFQNLSRGAKSSEICFFPLKTKKTNFFAKNFKIQGGLGPPLAPHCDAHEGRGSKWPFFSQPF